MSNKARHVVGSPPRRERPSVQGLQLGFAVDVKKDPNGTEWMGLTFGMGTVSFTLAVPASDRESFLELINGTVRDAYAEYERKSSGLITSRPEGSGLILPGQG